MDNGDGRGFLPCCQDDYGHFRPHCHACEQPVLDGVSANGASYHREHFKCKVCDELLADRPYCFQAGEAYCESDYDRLFTQYCGGCTHKITSGRTVTVEDGTAYHPNHFTCHTCQKDLLELNGYIRGPDSKLYCQEDYIQQFLPRCAYCHEPIRDEHFEEALGKTWHVDHLRCDVCDKALEHDGTFEGDQGQPLCAVHFAGTYVTVVGRLFRA